MKKKNVVNTNHKYWPLNEFFSNKKNSFYKERDVIWMTPINHVIPYSRHRQCACPIKHINLETTLRSVVIRI